MITLEIGRRARVSWPCLVLVLSLSACSGADAGDVSRLAAPEETGFPASATPAGTAGFSFSRPSAGPSDPGPQSQSESASSSASGNSAGSSPASSTLAGDGSGAPASGPEVVIVSEDSAGRLRSFTERAPSVEQLEEFLALVRQRSGVLSAAPNVVGELQGSPPNDKVFYFQKSYLRDIGVCCSSEIRTPNNVATGFMDAWDLPLSAEQRPVVAILDSGIEPIEEISGAITRGFNASNRKVVVPPDAMPIDGEEVTYDTAGAKEGFRHGTMVASVIGSIRNNSKSIAGLATYDAKELPAPAVADIAPYIVSVPTKYGLPRPDLKLVTDALDFMLLTFEKNAKGELDRTAWGNPDPAWKNATPSIVLMPFAFTELATMESTAAVLSPFINRLASHGVLVIASSAEAPGNNSPGIITPPASLPNVFRVGGLDTTKSPNIPATGSPSSSLIDLVAPATNVAVANKPPGILVAGGSVLTDGNSYSGAFVAAAAAMRIAKFGRRCTERGDANLRMVCLAQFVASLRGTATQPALDPGYYLGRGLLSVPTSVVIDKALPERTLHRPSFQLGIKSIQAPRPDDSTRQYSEPTLDINGLTLELPPGLPEANKNATLLIWWFNGQLQNSAAAWENGQQVHNLSIALPLAAGTTIDAWESGNGPGSEQKRQFDMALYVPGYGVSLTQSYSCVFTKTALTQSEAGLKCPQDL